MLYPDRIIIVIIYFCNNGFLLENFFKSLINRKESEPQFVISALAPAPGGILISAPQLRVRNTAFLALAARGVPRGDAQNARASPLPPPVLPPPGHVHPPLPQPERLVMRKDEAVFLYYVH
jgi:hypothetical protein